MKIYLHKEMTNYLKIKKKKQIGSNRKCHKAMKWYLQSWGKIKVNLEIKTQTLIQK